MYGGAIGQTGSSTVGWIMSLTLPIRSMYVTDSASMLHKTKAMIAAVKYRADQQHACKSTNTKPLPQQLGHATGRRPLESRLASPHRKGVRQPRPKESQRARQTS